MQQRQSDTDHLNWLARAGVKTFADKKILDLGCGSGFICQKASREGAKKTVGIDIVEPDFGQDSSAKNWSFLSLDLNAPKLADTIGDTFDLVLAFDIIEHLDSPYNFLKSCSELLSPTGRLILTTPNLMSWERFVNPRDWSGVRDTQHKVLFTKYSLRFLMGKCGFTNVELQAPFRSLSFLGPLQPQIGGQMLAVASI